MNNLDTFIGAWELFEASVLVQAYWEIWQLAGLTEQSGHPDFWSGHRKKALEKLVFVECPLCAGNVPGTSCSSSRISFLVHIIFHLWNMKILNLSEANWSPVSLFCHACIHWLQSPWWYWLTCIQHFWSDKDLPHWQVYFMLRTVLWEVSFHGSLSCSWRLWFVRGRLRGICWNAFNVQEVKKLKCELHPLTPSPVLFSLHVLSYLLGAEREKLEKLRMLKGIAYIAAF